MTTDTIPADDWRPVYAQAWAETIPAVLDRAYPYAAAHVSTGPEDCDVTPHVLHPAFWGSFDWHSSCHMQWSATQLLIVAGDHLSAEAAADLRRVLTDRLTVDAVATEVAYLQAHPRYERPYGWGWAAMLAAGAAQAHAAGIEGADVWAAACTPLLDAVLANLADWLPRLRYPVRSGEHANVAFGLSLVLDALETMEELGIEVDDHGVGALIGASAVRWFGDDRDYPAAWEPGGSDFLSPALAEADLMREVLPADEYVPWLHAFLPGLERSDHPLWALPVADDPTDGKGSHLLGLALHRAFALRSVSPALGAQAAEEIRRVTAGHIEAVSREIVEGDFMATHWLVSFALLAVEEA